MGAAYRKARKLRRSLPAVPALPHNARSSQAPGMQKRLVGEANRLRPFVLSTICPQPEPADRMFNRTSHAHCSACPQLLRTAQKCHRYYVSSGKVRTRTPGLSRPLWPKQMRTTAVSSGFAAALFADFAFPALTFGAFPCRFNTRSLFSLSPSPFPSNQFRLCAYPMCHGQGPGRVQTHGAHVSAWCEQGYGASKCAARAVLRRQRERAQARVWCEREECAHTTPTPYSGIPAIMVVLCLSMAMVRVPS